MSLRKPNVLVWIYYRMESNPGNHAQPQYDLISCENKPSDIPVTDVNRCSTTMISLLLVYLQKRNS